jgi:hypothetical protein
MYGRHLLQGAASVKEVGPPAGAGCPPERVEMPEDDRRVGWQGLVSLILNRALFAVRLIPGLDLVRVSLLVVSLSSPIEDTPDLHRLQL